MQIDIRVLELLSSKICHDLISPVSAINNGVELIEDIGEPVVTEAMKLIGDSAGLAARRLRLFRLCYGRAGSEENLSEQDVRPVIESYFASGKIALSWPKEMIPETFLLHRGGLKGVINLLLFAEEILAYGGSLCFLPHDEAKGKLVRVEVAGRGAQLSEPLREALEAVTPVEELTPRTVQAYVTGRFFTHFSLKVEHLQQEEDRLHFMIVRSTD